jgi:hypothetical protein
MRASACRPRVEAMNRTRVFRLALAMLSFTLLSSALDAARIVPAENGIYFALCPPRASCPHPARRFARPATDFLPRREALELALRTFLETSIDLVVVSLPTPRVIVLVAEREELERAVDLGSLARLLDGDPAQAAPATLRSLVDRITRPRVFLPLGMERTASGRDSLAAVPLWPDRSPLRGRPAG